MFRAHDPIELLERETRERIAPVNEHGQVHSRPLRTEPRIRDLDLKSLVVMYPLESHTLHRHPHLPRHEGDVGHARVDTGKRGFGAMERAGKRYAGLSLAESSLKMLDEPAVGGTGPDPNRATHGLRGAIHRQLIGHAPV